MAMQGCPNCCKASHQSPNAGPSCVAGFMPWLSALCRCFVCLKWHEYLCSGTGIAKISMTATHTHTPCVKRIDKDQETLQACLSAYFLYQQITSVVPWSAKGDGCIRDEYVKGSPSNCAQPRTGPNLSPVPLWRGGRSHCSCSSVGHASLLSTTQNSREAGQHNKEMQPRYLVYLPGSEKRCCCWFQIKMCFSTPLLSGEFIVFIHHYWLATCPDIYCVCFRRLRFSAFPKFLTFKTIWSPMGHLDLQCYWAQVFPLSISCNTERMS